MSAVARPDAASEPRLTAMAVGDLADFDADLAAAEQTAQQLRQLHYHWQLPLARATRALLAGRFAEAEEQAAQGLAIGQRAGDQAVEIYYAGAVATLRFMQGRLGETIELFQDLATRFPMLPVLRTALAAALAETGVRRGTGRGRATVPPAT